MGGDFYISPTKVKIHCFEGEWDRKYPELSVEPLIKLLEQLYISSGKHLTYSYKFCQSIERLRRDLQLDRRALVNKEFQHCLYFAFHSDGSSLWGDSDKESISFDEIATMLGQNATNSVIFLGSCGTRASKHALNQLKESTDAKLVIGYTSSVDWLLSSMFEIFFFNELCRYTNFGSFINRINQVIEQELFSKLKVHLAY